MLALVHVRCMNLIVENNYFYCKASRDQLIQLLGRPLLLETLELMANLPSLDFSEPSHNLFVQFCVQHGEVLPCGAQVFWNVIRAFANCEQADLLGLIAPWRTSFKGADPTSLFSWIRDLRELDVNVVVVLPLIHLHQHVRDVMDPANR